MGSEPQTSEPDASVPLPRNRILPMLVTGFVLIDALITVAGRLSGRAEFGPPGALNTVESLVALAATVALVWRRWRWAAALAAVAVVLVMIVGASAAELWFLGVSAVMVAALGSRRQLAAACLGYLLYAAAYGLSSELRTPDVGVAASLAVLGAVTFFLVVGGLGRLFLAMAARHRRTLGELTRQNAQIRTDERDRLADEVHTIVTDELDQTRRELGAVSRHPELTTRELHELLNRQDERTRATLAELRQLLWLLRQPESADSPPPIWVPHPVARTLALLSSAPAKVIATLAVAALVLVSGLAHGDSGSGAAQISGGLIGLAAAASVWSLRVGAVIAWAALPVSVIWPPTPSAWELLATCLAALAASLHPSLYRGAFTLAGLAAYCLAIMLVGDTGNVLTRVGWVGYSACLVTALGVWLGTLLKGQARTFEELRDLSLERARIHREERDAVARDLHDLVAHQLSLITMQIMATSSSSDNAALHGTIHRIHQHTANAQAELSTLVRTMRSSTPARESLTTIVRPQAAAKAFAAALTEHGFRPVVELDPGSNDLDVTAQRTLTRILQEATTNILRYGAAGECHYRLQISPTDVTVTITSPLRTTKTTNSLSTGLGLRGIHERVDLSHGSFYAGPSSGKWLVWAWLPLEGPESIDARALSVRVQATRI